MYVMCPSGLFPAKLGAAITLTENNYAARPSAHGLERSGPHCTGSVTETRRERELSEPLKRDSAKQYAAVSTETRDAALCASPAPIPCRDHAGFEWPRGPPAN